MSSTFVDLIILSPGYDITGLDKKLAGRRVRLASSGSKEAVGMARTVAKGIGCHRFRKYPCLGMGSTNIQQGQAISIIALIAELGCNAEIVVFATDNALLERFISNWALRARATAISEEYWQT